MGAPQRTCHCFSSQKIKKQRLVQCRNRDGDPLTDYQPILQQSRSQGERDWPEEAHKGQEGSSWPHPVESQVPPPNHHDQGCVVRTKSRQLQSDPPEHLLHTWRQANFRHRVLVFPQKLSVKSGREPMANTYTHTSTPAHQHMHAFIHAGADTARHTTGRPAL